MFFDIIFLFFFSVNSIVIEVDGSQSVCIIEELTAGEIFTCGYSILPPSFSNVDITVSLFYMLNNFSSHCD